MTTVETTAGTWTPNTTLASVTSELGLSNKGFARLMREVSRQDGGAAVSPDGSSLARYKSGEHQPSTRTLQVMVKVLEQITGHQFSTDELGYPDRDLTLPAIVHRPHTLSSMFFPSRLTFAGVCIWCQRRGCTAVECIEEHRASRWLVCPICDGTAIGCECTFGMILTEPAASTKPDLKVVR
ncbi:hypothetical protein [Nocardia seriolae]|uniref:Uncharacterized protein n=4 Tax=Nocardia seriolae TaxID=37332 RepID=A0A0B8N5A9_9NOCA|nr:hypothetical protein [Nocardia seriolae]APA94202.1 hypothetical protein NS506_00115 [Nocardia seriolae]MTJ60569.1 hypothetical protein [Nocardia seriolae]MTK28535.1 hypothetical protein [Nocardia seriolae]MTK38553.1 hypothetical protein [Nocardia seriolae]MTL10156.1 hypothetical protein [Nocardia seriolae]